LIAEVPTAGGLWEVEPSPQQHPFPSQQSRPGLGWIARPVLWTKPPVIGITPQKPIGKTGDRPPWGTTAQTLAPPGASVETDVSQTRHINPHLVLQPEGPPDTHPHIVAGVDGFVLLAIHAVSGVYGPLGRAEGPPACQC
jgi:hypothetical protein